MGFLETVTDTYGKLPCSSLKRTSILFNYCFNDVYKIPQSCTGYEISIFAIMQQDIIWTKTEGHMQYFRLYLQRIYLLSVTVDHSGVISNHSGV
jgi:hypothetical protein